MDAHDALVAARPVLRVVVVFAVGTLLAWCLPALALPALAAEPAAEPASDQPAPPPAFAALQADAPGLAEALSRHADGDTLAEAARVLLAADPRLRALVLPVDPVGPFPDRQGEDLRVDLLHADVHRDGDTLVVDVVGVGAADNGVWLEVDTRGGPAPDLLLGFGRGWTREATLDGGDPAPVLPAGVLPEVGPDRVRVAVDLAGSPRMDPSRAGRVTAQVRSFDGNVVDVGPGGFLGAPAEDALEVLAALCEGTTVHDADLAVALAITFGAVRPGVADGVVPMVDADAVAWLDYGQGLDAWLASVAAPWRLGGTDALGKLVWAWPAAQTVAYGRFAMAEQAAPLSADAWRFDVPGVDELVSLRTVAPRGATAAATADAVDAWVWTTMEYRTNDPLMQTFCRDGTVGREVCRAWSAERMRGASLGKVGGAEVALDQGVSAWFQLRRHAAGGRFVGDCATATSMAIWTLQALGIPALGMGWAGTDPGTPTHDVPLWYDGTSFRATQAGPARDWSAESAFVYVTLPGVHPVNALSLAREPNGWSRGGAVAGGWTRFAEVRRILAEGLPAAVVGGWVDVQAAGGWPTW